MRSLTQNRRQHPRGDGILVKIEDVTYRVLRNYEQVMSGARMRRGERVTLIEVATSCHQTRKVR